MTTWDPKSAQATGTDYNSVYLSPPAQDLLPSVSYLPIPHYAGVESDNPYNPELRSHPLPDMVVKTLVSMLAVASCCQGAAIFSDNDEWFDATQNFLMDPEPLVTPFGAQRAKRDAACDREYSLAVLGSWYEIHR